MKSNEIIIPKSIQRFLTFIVGGFFLLLIWGIVFEMDVLSISKGKVTPQGEVRAIQHLEGGIVKEILVQPGDRVKKGDDLILLDSISTGADFGEVDVKLTFLELEQHRLKAEVELSPELSIPENLSNNYMDMVNNAISLHNTIMKKYNSKVLEYTATIQQKESELQEVEVTIKNLKSNMKILNKQIAISDKLLKEEITNEYTHFELLRKQIELKTSIDTYSSSLNGLKSSVTIAEEQLNSYKHTFIAETKDDLKKVTQELDQLRKRQDKFQDTLDRTVIKSPVDGTIKSLRVYTKGGVIKAGETVMQIVPSNDKLIVEALMLPQDIGYVQKGQYAFLRLDSIDAMKFEKLDGKVVFVSPDTFNTEQGQSFYKVHIETQSNHFKSDGLSCNLVPGMEVVAHIRIGSRSVFSYLLDPFKPSMDLALSEK